MTNYTLTCGYDIALANVKREGGMIMKKAIFILLLVLLVCLTGCGETSETPATSLSKMQQTFVDIGYTESESIQIENALSEVGITKCKVVVTDEETTDGMRVVACSFNDPEVDGYFSTIHGEVSVIGSSDGVWYDSEQGGVLCQIPDTYVSSSAETILMKIAEDVAAQIAQNPSTVKFSTLEWGFSREGLVYAVQGTFSCSNLMGVSEKHTLQVWCESSEDYSKIQPYKVVMDGVVLTDTSAN